MSHRDIGIFCCNHAFFGSLRTLKLFFIFEKTSLINFSHIVLQVYINNTVKWKVGRFNVYVSFLRQAHCQYYLLGTEFAHCRLAISTIAHLKCDSPHIPVGSYRLLLYWLYFTVFTVILTWMVNVYEVILVPLNKISKNWTTIENYHILFQFPSLSSIHLHTTSRKMAWALRGELFFSVAPECS